MRAASGRHGDGNAGGITITSASAQHCRPPTGGAVDHADQQTPSAARVGPAPRAK